MANEKNVSLNRLRKRFMNGNDVDILAARKGQTAIAVYKAHDNEGDIRPCISLMLHWTGENGALSLDEALGVLGIDPDDNIWNVGDPNDGTRI